MGLADELLEDAHFLADKGIADQRQTLMRRSISTEALSQLQRDRGRADYDGGWRLVETDVGNAIRLAEDVFTTWRRIRGEDIVRHHLLSMFGTRPD